MLTPLPGVQRRMVLEGMSAKKRLLLTQTGPSTQVNPVAMRSSLALAGTIRLLAGSARSTWSGVIAGAVAAADCAGTRSAAINRQRSAKVADAMTRSGLVEMVFIRNFLSCRNVRGTGVLCRNDVERWSVWPIHIPGPFIFRLRT